MAEMFDGLFPAWTTIVGTIIALLLIMFVLSKFVWNPIKKMHDSRVNYIQSNIDEAERLNQEASQDRAKANDEVATARLEAAEILAAARIEAEEVKHANFAKVQKDVDRIMRDARNDIDAQHARFAQDSRNSIIEVAMEVASKVVEKEISSDVSGKIVDEFLRERQ